MDALALLVATAMAAAGAALTNAELTNAEERSSVTDMHAMFEGASSFDQRPTKVPPPQPPHPHPPLPPHRHPYPHPHPLRHNWHATPYDPVVHEIDAQMNDCSTTAHCQLRNSGYGSVLHSWATYLCYAMEHGASLVTAADGNWFDAWDGNGTTVCHDEHAAAGGGSHHRETRRAPLTCFYGHRANTCGPSPLLGKQQIDFWTFGKVRLEMPEYDPFFHAGDSALRRYHNWDGCPSWSHRRGTPFFVTAFKWLFSRLSPRLVNLTREAAIDVFGPRGARDALVTVHMRWGDKARDNVTLQPAARYAEAVEALVATHLRGVHSSKIGVFVTTEDGAALTAFRKEARLRDWTVYTYAPALLHDEDHFDVAANGSRAASMRSPLEEAQAEAARSGEAVGWAGVHSIIALLLALEARLYVVTAVGSRSSNWGRLLDEMRMAFVNDSYVTRI